jgi:AcrR family transcriptional regulator
MQKHQSSEDGTTVLRPTTPPDLSEQTQRQRIVDAMIESCAEKTYAATTIADIVASARISRTTFYKHFADKRACFDAAIDYCVAQLEGVAGSAHSQADGPGDATRKAATAVLECLAARPGLAQLLSGDALAVEPAVIERYRRATIPALEALWGGGGDDPTPHLDPRLTFGQAQVLLLNQIATGKADQLPQLLPEIVYLAVSPFGGHEEALRQSERAGGSKSGGARNGARQA